MNTSSDLVSAPRPTSVVAADKVKACDAVGAALDTGTVGDMVAKHEKLILHYYGDVLDQAKQSFRSAKVVAWIGFAVLIVTLAYTLLFDAMTRLHIAGLSMVEASRTAVSLGVVSGALIEFIAGVDFWLYNKAARQFAAFHICLERTHRYLVAYKIAQETEEGKDETLRNLVCIMASAPMITPLDSDGGAPSLASAPRAPNKAGESG